MRYLKIILQLLVILGFHFPPTVFAQNEKKGLILDDPAYKENIQRQYIGPAFTDEPLPDAYSLRKYCPIAGDQGDMGSCVGWAVGYGAYSILNAVQTNNTNRKDITTNAYSALYLYNQIKASDCEHGARISQALLFSKQKGDCLKSKFNPDDCFVKPGLDLQTLKVKDYQALFYGHESSQIKLNAVKQKIAGNIPVVMGFETNTLFSTEHVTKDNPVWRSGGANDGGHAVVIVGYNDNSQLLEVLNSWGTKFGDDGFFYMKYEDFIIYGRSVAAMFLPELVSTIKLNGEGILRYYDKNLQKLQDVMVTRNNTEYETAKNTWDKGTIFQLLIKKPNQNEYIYVFSINDKNEVKIHFPRRKEYNNLNAGDKKANESALLTNFNSQLFIPNNETGLQLNTSDEYLSILFSKSEIPDFQKVLTDIANLKAGGTQLDECIRRAFANRVVKKEETNFNENTINFSSSSSERDIVPIIIHLRAM